MMKTVSRYFLATLCSLTLVLPAGWCCYVVPEYCCSTADAKDPAPGQPEKKCCCPHEELAQPAQSQPTPKPSPASNCCCERQPLAPLEREAPSPGLSLALDMPAPEANPANGFQGCGVDDISSPVLPSLHVLHCVWRC